MQCCRKAKESRQQEYARLTVVHQIQQEVL